MKTKNKRAKKPTVKNLYEENLWLRKDIEQLKANLTFERMKMLRLVTDIKNVSDLAKAMETAHLRVSTSSQPGSNDNGILRETSVAWMRARIAIDQVIERNDEESITY